ncbi:hypothetical protein ACHAXT_002329 [Thalassiosira profunda]
MASLNCRVYASSSEEQSSRDQRLRSAKLDEDASTTNLRIREGERAQPRPDADGAAEVGGVPAVGPEGDAGGSTHRNRREKGGKNAAPASDARAQPGSSDGSAPSRSSRENEQPNLSATGPGVGVGAASAAGTNDASSEEGRKEEPNDGVQRKTPPELLAAGQEGAASNLRPPKVDTVVFPVGLSATPSAGLLSEASFPSVEVGTLNWTCRRCNFLNFAGELECYGCKYRRGEPLSSKGSAYVPHQPLPPLPGVANVDFSSEEGREEESNDGVQRKTPPELLAAGQGGAASNDAGADQGAAELAETLLAGPLGWVLLPQEQWPERFRQLYDARTTGNIVAPFVKRQPEYKSLQDKVEKGRHLVTFDSFTHDWSHCYILVFLNFNSDSNVEAWLKRLLWLDKNGQIGESCLKAVIDLLVNIFVKCHNVRREYAEFAIKECTVFMDRTLETGKYDWCDGNLTSFRSRVKVTDGDTCDLVRKCVRKFPQGALPVILGEHSYKAIGLGVGQSDGPWLKGTSLQLSQTGKMSHPARLMQPWQSEGEMNYNLLVWKALASILVGQPAAHLTAEEDRELMPFATTAGGIATAKKTAMNKGECCWSLLECKLCGATREGSLDSLSRGKSCSGSDGQGCRGHSDGKGGYKTAMHSEWIVLEIREVLNCCKSKPWALWWLSHFEQDRCFCYDCEPGHAANKERKHREERKKEKEERAAKRAKRAAEVREEKEERAAKRAKREAEAPKYIARTPEGRWKAQIYYAGKTRYLGTFDSQEAAGRGYEAAQALLLGKASVGEGTDEEREAEAKRNVGLAKEAARQAVEGAMRPKRTKRTAEAAEKMPKEAVHATQRPSGWEAKIGYAGKSRYLGMFDSQEAAALGYEAAKTLLEKASVGEGTDEEREAEARRNVGLAQEAARRAVEGAMRPKRTKRTAEKMPTGVKQASSGKFEARIAYAGKTRHIGTFDSKEEAVQGRKMALEVLQKACVIDGTDEEKEAKAKQNVDLAKEAARQAVEERSLGKPSEEEMLSIAIRYHENTSDIDAPMLMGDSRQPAEVFNEWLDLRKRTWSNGRSFLQEVAAEEKTEEEQLQERANAEDTAEKQRKGEEKEAEKQRIDAAAKAEKQRKAAEVAARAEVYRPLVIAAIESRAKQAGSAPTLEKIVRADLGEQFHRATFNSLLRKMVRDGELTQNKSTYLRADVEAEERRAKEAAEKEEKEERAKEKEAKKQRKAAEKEAEKQRKAAEKKEEQARVAAKQAAARQRPLWSVTASNYCYDAPSPWTSAEKAQFARGLIQLGWAGWAAHATLLPTKNSAQFSAYASVFKQKYPEETSALLEAHAAQKKTESTGRVDTV